AVPRVTRVVTLATPARSRRGSPRGLASSESPTHTESYPLFSACRAASMTAFRSPFAHSRASLDGSRRPVSVGWLDIAFLLLVAKARLLEDGRRIAVEESLATLS